MLLFSSARLMWLWLSLTSNLLQPPKCYRMNPLLCESCPCGGFPGLTPCFQFYFPFLYCTHTNAYTLYKCTLACTHTYMHTHVCILKYITTQLHTHTWTCIYCRHKVTFTYLFFELYSLHLAISPQIPLITISARTNTEVQFRCYLPHKVPAKSLPILYFPIS